MHAAEWRSLLRREKKRGRMTRAPPRDLHFRCNLLRSVRAMARHISTHSSHFHSVGSLERALLSPQSQRQPVSLRSPPALLLGCGNPAVCPSLLDGSLWHI